MKQINRTKNLPKPNEKPNGQTLKKSYVSQSDVPKHSIEEAVNLARGLFDAFNGDSLPHELANAMGISPTSSAWRSLTGAAVAYGLTEGAYNAPRIKLTP